jgi:hypothetical protein
MHAVRQAPVKVDSKTVESVRVANEQIEAEAQAKAATDARQQAEQERAAERAEQERVFREKEDAERAERERVAVAKEAAEKVERERIARETEAADKAEQDRVIREKAAAEKVEQDRSAKMVEGAATAQPRDVKSQNGAAVSASANSFEKRLNELRSKSAPAAPTSDSTIPGAVVQSAPITPASMMVSAPTPTASSLKWAGIRQHSSRFECARCGLDDDDIAVLIDFIKVCIVVVCGRMPVLEFAVLTSRLVLHSTREFVFFSSITEARGCHVHFVGPQSFHGCRTGGTHCPVGICPRAHRARPLAQPTH